MKIASKEKAISTVVQPHMVQLDMPSLLWIMKSRPIFVTAVSLRGGTQRSGGLSAEFGHLNIHMLASIR